MYSKEPVWLLPDEIVRKYENFCFVNNITERRLVRLFDNFLLRGRINRNSKKVEILEESFEDLRNHIRYNLFKQGSKSEAKGIMPDYCKIKYQIPYDSSMNWYTPKEILEIYSTFLKYEKSLTSEFIGELAYIGLLTGKYNPSENCYHIHLPSFVEFLKYREYSLMQYRWLPGPEEPFA